MFVRVGGGYMRMNEFIDSYTDEEVQKIYRNDVSLRFQGKLAAQYIAGERSQGSVERSPISKH